MLILNIQLHLRCLVGNNSYCLNYYCFHTILQIFRRICLAVWSMIPGKLSQGEGEGERITDFTFIYIYMKGSFVWVKILCPKRLYFSLLPVYMEKACWQSKKCRWFRAFHHCCHLQVQRTEPYSKTL